MELTATTLADACNKSFLTQWNTKLCGGFHEPLYLPATAERSLAEIQFTGNSVRSALHELAHWSIAGARRRKLTDYGYWYSPDGRNIAEQEMFFKAEVKPQAVEKKLAELCAVPFEVSCDNLGGVDFEKTEFEYEVAQQLARYEASGFPPRAKLLMDFLKTLNISAKQL